MVPTRHQLAQIALLFALQLAAPSTWARASTDAASVSPPASDSAEQTHPAPKSEPATPDAAATAVAPSEASSTPSSSAAADKATARLSAKQGIEMYRAQRYAEALERLQRAQQLFDAPVHLLYIAR